MKVIVAFLAVVLVISGCAAFNQSANREEPGASKGEVLNQAFYGFPDVPIPRELKLSHERTFVYETPTLKVGVLVLSGNADLESLENYFKINMAKNGWKFVNIFRFKDVALNFTKEDRTCNIKMSRGSFTTDVEIWIGPSSGREVIQRGNEPK